MSGMASSGSASDEVGFGKETPMASSTCFVCLGELKDARLLTCLHSCCRQCIDKMAVTATQQTIACPVCRTKCTLPPNGAGGLPKDITQTSKERASASDECSADDCHAKSALWCKECKRAFCKQDGVMHLASSLGDHTIGPIPTRAAAAGEAVHSFGAAPCVDHGEPLVLFCVKCDEIICGHCVAIGKHAGHQPITPIQEAVSRKKKKALEVVDEIQLDRVPEVGASLQAVRDRTAQLTRRASEVRGEIRRSEERAVGMVRAYAQQLVEKVDDAEEARCKDLDKQKDGLESHLNGLKNAVDFCDRLMKNREANGADLASILDAFVKRSLDLSKTHFDKKPLRHACFDFQAVSDEGLTANLTNAVGLIKTHDASAPKCTASPSAVTCFPGNCVDITVVTRNDSGEDLSVGGSCVTAAWSKFPGGASTRPPIEVEDLESGLYRLSFVPRQQGIYHLQISVNGEKIPELIVTTCLERSHRFDPAECHGNISLSEDLLLATRNTNGSSAEDPKDQCRECVLGAKGMWFGRHWWKVRVGHTLYWSFLGIASKPLPPKGFYSYLNACGWTESGKQSSFAQGEKATKLSKMQGNDVLRFDLDCEAHTLTITQERTGKTDTIKGLPQDTMFFPFFCMEHGQRGMSIKFV